MPDGARLSRPASLILGLRLVQFHEQPRAYPGHWSLPAGGRRGQYLPAHAASANPLLTWGLGLGQLLGVVLLVANGTILGTVYAKLLLPLCGLLLASVVFKISHLPWASEMLWGSLGGIALTYSIWFGRKPQKDRLDVLKLLWVLASCGSALLILLYRAPREVAYVAPMLLWLAVLDFLASENKKRPTS